LLAAAWLPDPRWGVVSVLAAAALVNLASQAGDLLESAAKRQAGVKDSGTLFGPSGGFLDLVDSLLLSVPVALLTWPLLFEGLG
jgi:phosphatidate cytidylyltransferase